MAKQLTLEEKLCKLPGGAEFRDEVIRLNTDQLEKRISSMQKNLEESRIHKEANEALKHAKAEVSELSGPYNDVENAVKLKTKFLIGLLKEKGSI